MAKQTPKYYLTEALKRVNNAIVTTAELTPNDHGGLAQLHMVAFTLQLMVDDCDNNTLNPQFKTALMDAKAPDEHIIKLIAQACADRARYEDDLCADGRLDTCYNKAINSLEQWV